MNIAEGNGKRSKKDRCRYLDIARGSALESAACLDVFVARKLTVPEEVAAGKALLRRVVEMLTKLTASQLRRTAWAYVGERSVDYEHDYEHEHEHEVGAAWLNLESTRNPGRLRSYTECLLALG